MKNILFILIFLLSTPVMAGEATITHKFVLHKDRSDTLEYVRKNADKIAKKMDMEVISIKDGILRVKIATPLDIWEISLRETIVNEKTFSKISYTLDKIYNGDIYLYEQTTVITDDKDGCNVDITITTAIDNEEATDEIIEFAVKYYIEQIKKFLKRCK